MEIVLITVGKTKTRFIEAGIEEYKNRLKRYIVFSIIQLADIRTSKAMSEKVQKEREGQMILDKLSPADYMVLLDEKGKEFTSVEFSTYMEKLMASGRKRIVFIVGGPYGFSQPVYERADSKLSLSRMTFNHEMVRMFFIEQIYRAFTILKGEPYHHE